MCGIYRFAAAVHSNGSGESGFRPAVSWPRAAAQPIVVFCSPRVLALAAVKDLSRHQSGTDVAGNLLQLYLALGETAPVLQLLESFCPVNPVGCGDLANNPIYRVLRANPRFQQLAKRYNTQTLE